MREYLILNLLPWKKTYKIQFNTPKRLDQCHSCKQAGTNNLHCWYGCENELCFKNYTIDKNAGGLGELHNCYLCNESCKSCCGDFVLKKTTWDDFW